MENWNRTDLAKSWSRHLRKIERVGVVTVMLACAGTVHGQTTSDEALSSTASQSTAADGSATGAGARDLDAFLGEVKTLKADFTQQVLAADGHVLKSASGSMALARPDRFRWVYDKPYKQIIVADGKTLWIYDIGLEQVTRAPMGETAPSSPAMLLSGGDDVKSQFRVVESFQRDGLDWVRLAPKRPEADFSSIVIGFEGSSPHRLELEDSLNQRTVIELDDVQLNTKLKRGLFDFDPPRGVDVIGGSD